MGYGSYSHAAHEALTTARSGASQAEIFRQQGCHDLMNPFGVKLRESRDTEDHPESVGVVFALDVSGSMGEIPYALAIETLPDFMAALLEAGARDPQVLFMGIGFAGGDAAPLQVGQFESTESLMDQWLTSLYLEGAGGGGNESYELAFYFAARHMAMDCVEKRGRRGYLFITGDEPPNPAVSRAHVKRLIGDDLSQDIAVSEIIDEAMRKFEPFFLIPDPDRARSIERAWRDLLGDRVVVLSDPADTSYAAAGLVSLLEGAVPSLPALVERWTERWKDGKRPRRIAHSLLPFASSIGKDGTPAPELGGTDLPRGNDPSSWTR